MKKWRIYLPLLTLVSSLTIVFLVLSEVESSSLQAKLFSKIAKQLTFSVRQGVSSHIVFPELGPYDIRLGYNKIPSFVKSLERNGYVVDEQSEMSARMRQFINFGLFPVYHEKTYSGINIKDRKGEQIYSVVRPERSFATFNDIPKIVADTLLFIENREILDPNNPKKNPAVEWSRLGKALIEKGLQEIYPDRSAPGGSTLATQIEKYRHSKDGRTRKAKDKFKQMFTASFRAYLDGEDTTENRKKIVLDYINSIPLAAVSGYGEVNGLGDGLWAWYGVDFGEISKILNHPEDYKDPEKFKIYALAYKQVLSLFLSHRRPSSFLLTDVRVLNGFADDYLDLLANNKIITEELKNQAQELDLHLRSTAPKVESASFLANKSANAIRTQLLNYFNISKLYELDQYDLRVHSTIDQKIQDEVTKSLISLKDKENAVKLGLSGEHALGKGDLTKVLYSVTLYEHVNGRNLLRVQTDNLDKPFNINEGTKLDLGSTAKLRVTTNYLQIVDKLHEKFASLDKKDLLLEQKKVSDPISVWALSYLLTAKDKSLAPMLDAAMERKYSASPGETFFTGGGVHHFVNFKKEDNGKVPSISEALRFSINLPFIRLMRDIVRYYMANIPGSPTNIKDDINEEARMAYLEKFADKEGSYFLDQFYIKYQKLDTEEILPTLLNSIQKTPKRLAAIYRYVYPEKNLEEFSNFLRAWLAEGQFDRIKNVNSIYESYAPNKFSLQDQG
nr:transglycosylase domain-containing protein [Pseudomonadota bacterium]